MSEIVWMVEERTFAEMVRRGAHFSVVKYSQGGYEYEILVGNDEFDDYDEGTDDTDEN